MRQAPQPKHQQSLKFFRVRQCSPEGNEDNSTCHVELLQDSWKIWSGKLKRKKKMRLSIDPTQPTKGEGCKREAYWWIKEDINLSRQKK